MCYMYFINHLKNYLYLHYKRKSFSFHTQNTVHLNTKGESVNDVYGNIMSLLLQPQEKHK
jgi:hypothetical protein